MKRTTTTVAVALLSNLLLCQVTLAAPLEPRGLGDPGTLQSLLVETGRGIGGFTLAGRDASQQLLVTGRYSTGQMRDLTRDVSFETTPADTVHIDATGMVTPLKEGQATLHVLGPNGIRATTSVKVMNQIEDLPVHFVNQVVPVFTKFGCNSGGCHGKADGQNGFKLSLLGFEPADDFDFLVKEARGRRLFPAAPDYSLLLRKATGQTPHGGGKRLDVQSPYYRVVRRWIEQGAPLGRPDEPVVVRIEVLPKERLLERTGQQQLVVIAHHSDGSTSDVTPMTQFESNLTELAEVSPTGLVSTKQLAGSAAIMTRYQALVDVFRATVPLGAPVESLPPAKNFVDERVFERLRQLGLPPSPVCDDATFLRRVTLDLAGRLPARAEVEPFLADSDPAKREKRIDQLLAGGDYADYFANKWSAILRNRRQATTDDPKPTAAFHAWIREGLEKNRPYDQLVRDVLTATGEEIQAPPVVWYREVKDMTTQLEDTAQLFLGQRIGCARCHHHPFEKWSQHDYYGFAAFFSRVVVKDPPAPRAKGKNNKPEPKPPLVVSHNPGSPQALNPRTGRLVPPTGLGSPPLPIEAGVDPRTRLVDWMTAKDNPFFAKALVNRYWKHFFGRGLVDPEDDLRVTNPPSNPALLDALARHFIEHQFDLKDLVRTICVSRVYQLSAVPNAFNADDRQNGSRFVPKRLHAEVLLDAIDEVTLSKTSFRGAAAGTRAIQLPDNLFQSYFLSVFGRPDSASACECERSSDASLAQCLHMFNSAEMLAKVNGARAKQLAGDQRPHEERLRDLYLLALSRPPSKEETTALLAHIDRKKANVQGAYEDILWALINTKEFLFNH